MADLIQISLEETGNLLGYKSLLKDNPTISFSATGVSSNYEIVNDVVINANVPSFKANLYQNVTLGNNALFNFGDALEFTANRSGTHTFSFFLMQGLINAVLPYNVDVKVNVFINSSLTHTFVTNVNLETYSPDIRLAQSFYLESTDLVNFTFEVDKASIGIPNPNIELFFTCFQVNYGNVTDYNLPKSEQITGYQSRVDTTNTQNLTALTENLISFSGTLEQNGGLTLMDSNAKITPIHLNDIISVDFSFTSINPAGTDQYINCNFVVDGVVYRSQTFSLVKGAGFEDNCSVSFVFPVTATFLANGGEFYLYPSSATTIKNRYIAVTRIGKGV